MKPKKSLENDTGTGEDPQPIAREEVPDRRAFIPRELPPSPDAPCWVCGRPLADGNHEHES